MGALISPSTGCNVSGCFTFLHLDGSLLGISRYIQSYIILSFISNVWLVLVLMMISTMTQLDIAKFHKFILNSTGCILPWLHSCWKPHMTLSSIVKHLVGAGLRHDRSRHRQVLGLQIKQHSQHPLLIVLLEVDLSYNILYYRISGWSWC